MIDWHAFKGECEERFLLPLDSYRFTVSFVEHQPTAEQLARISQRLTGATVDALRRSPRPSLYSLETFTASRPGFYFNLAYGDPTYGFQIHLGSTTLGFTKYKCSLEELVLTMPVLTSIVEQTLLPDGEHSVAGEEFFKLVFRTSHQFNQTVELGCRMSARREKPTREDIMQFFYNFGPGSAYTKLVGDEVIRTDTELSVKKEVGKRPADVWVSVRAPYSATRREIGLSFELRREESSDERSKIGSADFLEFDVAMTSFYKDIVMDRIFKTVFNDVEIAGSMR